MSIQSYEDFVPRSAMIKVGGEALHVEELVAVKRDALVRIILAEVDVIRLFGPFIRGLGKVFGANEDVETEDQEDDFDFGEVFGDVKKSIANILGKNLTRVSCVVLDTTKNRQIVGIENEEKAEDEDGIFFCPHMHNWIKENLTLRQEQELIKALVTTNDFVGLVKNYISLVKNTARVINLSDDKNEK